MSLAWLRTSALIALLSIPGVAAADPRDEAGRHFQSGLRLFRQRQFAAARLAFSRAYAILPDARVLANEAACLAAEGRPVEASRTYRVFLDRAGPSVSVESRRLAEREIARLRPVVGELTIATSPAGAEIRVDGELVGTSPIRVPIIVRPGVRLVEARARGRATSSQSVTVPIGRSESVALILDPLPTTASAPTGVSEASASTPRDRSRPWTAIDQTTDERAHGGQPPAFWVSLSLTGALVTAGVVTGLYALSSRQDHDDAQGERERAALGRQTRTLSIATDVLLDTAAVGALVTLGLLIFGGPSERADIEARVAQGLPAPGELSF